MRVIAGTARRLNLVTPQGETTRPTQDRIKETLFNMIQMEVPGAVFADLCAGSGGIAIEALSRGAVRAYLVENNKEALSCIAQNLKKTKMEEAAVVIKQDVLTALHKIHEKQLDLIYVDPPYQGDLLQRILASLSEQPYVTEETVIIAETSLDSDLSYLEEYGLVLEREKRYKSQRHVFIARKGTQE